MSDQAPEPTPPQLRGLHHVTVIVADLDATTAFYRDILGLTLITQETNPDDPSCRQFWFGDALGTPGTLVLFMEYPSVPEATVGRGGVRHFAFQVGSATELLVWRDYLRKRGVPCTDVFDRTRLQSVYFRDPDGMLLELASSKP